jgi:diguanylate cyclase (GGDEF)-like protein
MAGLAVATALAWQALATHVKPPVPNVSLPWLVVAAGFVAAQLMVVRFEFRNEAHGVGLAEVPMLAGLVFMASNRLLLAAVAGTAVAVVGRRLPVIKACFNITIRCVELIVALVCYHAVLGGASPTSTRGWLAAFVAVVTANLVSGLGVQVVIALASGRPFDRSGLRRLPFVVVGVSTINAGLGLAAVYLLMVNLAGVILLGGIVAVFGIGYRAYNALLQRYGHLEQLYGFSQALVARVETDDVVRAVLSEAKALVRGEVAQLMLYGNDGPMWFTLDRDGELVLLDESGFRRLEETVESSRTSILVPRATNDRVMADALAACGVRDAVVAPVPNDSGRVGVLLVANRLGDQLAFDRSDAKLLGALANHSAMALRSSDLLERLRIEVAAKNHQASHDALTGLANRTLFSSRADASLAQRSSDTVVAVMLMDLDRFKEVNDTLGHPTGDSVLQEMAGKLTGAVAERGLVARLGGDEFAILIPCAADRGEVADIARSLLAAAHTTILVEGILLELRASLGIAIAPEHGGDRATLLQRADVAMYQAKTSGTGVEVYDPARDHHTTRRLVLVNELHRALDTSALKLYYQPKAEMASNRVIGVEALLRWTHELYGVIHPEEFVSLAEQCGLIHSITRWVLHTGLTQLGSWRQEGLDLTLAVNLSARNLLEADLVGDIASLLVDSGVPPERLTLELTESSIIGDRIESLAVLDALAALGIQLSIDDFGTGYSSLSRLRRLPFHELKIDRSFVTTMLANDDDLAIVSSTIGLGRNLGLVVVAEGVEDATTWGRLLQLNCNAAQGYHFSRPLPAEQLEGRLWHQAPTLNQESK